MTITGETMSTWTLILVGAVRALLPASGSLVARLPGSRLSSKAGPIILWDLNFDMVATC